MTTEENRRLLSRYIPVEEVEDLLKRSKRSLKRQIKILKRREDIERHYVRSLNEWVNKTTAKVDFESNYDHKDIRLFLMVSVREGEATAMLHEKLADSLSQSDGVRGPICALTGFKMQHFKKTGQDFEVLKAKEKISSYLDNFIKQYKSALKEIFDVIKQAEMAAKSEIRIEEQIQERVEKLERMEKSTTRIVQYEARSSKCKQNIRDLKSQLDVMESKRENFIAKAKSLIKRRVPILDDIMQAIAEVERNRIRVFSRAVGMSLDHVSMLGPEAKEACKTAKELLEHINPEIIVADWCEEKKIHFTIKDKEDLRSQPPGKSLHKQSLGTLNDGLHSPTPPLHLFSASPKPAEKYVVWELRKPENNQREENTNANNALDRIADLVGYRSQLVDKIEVNKDKDYDSDSSSASNLSESSILRKFTEEDDMTTDLDKQFEWAMGNGYKLQLLQSRRKKDPFAMLSGQVDMKLLSLFDYESKDPEELSLEKGQHVQMKFCYSAYKMGWGWTRRMKGKGAKVYGKFPLFCVDPY